MPDVRNVAPESELAVGQSLSDDVAGSAAGDRQIDLLMGSVFCAWELATHEEAQLALRWARRMIGQSRLAFADIDETTYVVGGQYLQALISGRRRTPVA